MRALLVVLALSVSVSVSGCATPITWSKAGATQAEFKQDETRCIYEAEVATAGIRSGIEAGFTQARLVPLCLESKGYIRQ